MVNASATLAAGVGAHFNLVVDGVVVGDATVGTALHGYSFPTTLTPGQPHDIKIAYDNDAYINGQDRNLLLQSIAVDGQVVNATDSREVYHATSGPGDLPSDGTMAWNGNAEFSLPASFFATPALPPTPVPTPTPTPTPVPTPTGTDTIVVNASATLAAGVGAHFNLVVDGVVVGDATVGTALHGYSFPTTLTPGQPHDIKIAYDNDAYINGQDRNLLLQSISIDGQVVNATDSREVYHATSGPGDLPSDGTMAWNGNAEFSLPASFFATPAPSPTPVPTPTPTPTPTPVPTPTGTDTIVVNASATLAAGVGAHFNLVVDGVVVGDATVGTALQGYSFPTTLTPGQPHDIKIAYDNDAYINGQDRNLLLQSIAVDGQVVNATDSREVYHATSGPGDLPSDGTMAWNGNAEFSLPASFFATPALTPVPIPAPTPTMASTPVPRPPAPIPTSTSTTTSPAFYVATSGSDSGDGSTAHPFGTLARATSAMEGSAIHTTYVEGGTYATSSTLALTQADSGFTFSAYAGQTAIISGSGSLQTLISLQSTQSVTLAGLTLENTASGSGAILLTGASGNTISAETILMAGGSAIEVKDGSNNNVISNNTINGVGASETNGGGVYLHGANGNQIVHNFVENTQGSAISLSDFYTNSTATQNIGDTVSYNDIENADLSSTDSGAIYILGRSKVDTQTTVNMNFVNGTGRSGEHSVGIYLDDNTSGVTATNNIVTGIGSDAFEIHGGSDDTFQNNIFDLGAGAPSAGLFQPPPSDQPNANANSNDTVDQNVYVTDSDAPRPSLFANLGGGAPSITANDFWSTSGSALSVYPETDGSFQDPGFTDASYKTAGDGIGFVSIDRSLIGLQH